MNQSGVCGVCGKHLAQQVGTLALRHTMVYGPELCEGYDTPVMSVDQWTDWAGSPISDDEL